MIYFLIIVVLLSMLVLLESLHPRLVPPVTAIGIFILLTLFAALRPPGADKDYETYVSFFNIFSDPPDYFNRFIMWGFFEPAYYLIPSILKYWLHVQSFEFVTFFMFAVVGCTVVMLGINKLTKFYFAAILTLFCNFFLLHELTQIRAAIAIGFFFLCIYYKEQRNWLYFLLCVFISFLFHYSSLLAFSILFLSGKSINRPIYLGLTLLSFALSFVDFGSILNVSNVDAGALSEKQEMYINSVQEDLLNRRSFVFLLHFFNTLFLLIFVQHIYQENKYIYLLIKIQVIGLLAFQVLSAYPTISSRIADYYLSVHIITLSCCYYVFKNRLWPALVLCLVNTAVLLLLLLRNHLIDLTHYSMPGG